MNYKSTVETAYNGCEKECENQFLKTASLINDFFTTKSKFLGKFST